ncbi:MAG TPA: hypothetical protein VGT44_15430 [Ktedonobacteraceae bacterium]|nr:hypothetical protein [Ktedonobacteraceae bacterium]
MQTFTGRNPGGMSQQARRIATFAIILFGLSGLISGFAVGAFVHPKLPGGTGGGGNGTPTTIARSTSTRTTTTPENVPVGEPLIKKFTYHEAGNGTKTYAFSVEIVYDGTTTPIKESDVTCKLWLTADNGAMNNVLSANNNAILKNIDQISQPFAGEVQGAFQFISPAQQVQNCVPGGGETTWNYTVSSSVDPGTYYIFSLADWQGKHYNWRSVQIKVV